MLRRTMRIRPSLLAVMAVVVTVALSGCSSRGPAADGPLSSGTSMHGPIPRGSECVPGGRPQAFGITLFTNYGHLAVKLDRVVLLRPHNERLIGSFAVPGVSVLGVAHWPPNIGWPPGWPDRQPVRGFRLVPGKSFNMVLGVMQIARDRLGTSQGMLVYYHDSSGSYVAKDYWANIISANTRTCT